VRIDGGDFVDDEGGLEIGDDVGAFVGLEQWIEGRDGGAQLERGERDGGERPAVRQRDRDAIARPYAPRGEIARERARASLELRVREAAPVPYERRPAGITARRRLEAGGEVQGR
jgi:hypothetical protein